ncbi:2Fe-2S iron-sulfur cluster-binding protein [Paenibacillus turpanensis]|uniref:2Fe-2S iron-sulfur cluster-binding protein n=1 Tax=Paenibacillus turpanensis TaxID=2689078 RepID=UPI00140D71F8|nr:2Fe-2S iron-sulfur cluster-binding protein [Paenibacillus turpanensis]
MITLRGKTVEKTIDEGVGMSLLDLALKHGIDFQFSCTRGTCARCRCYVDEGKELLNEPTDEEWDRLDEDEIEEGYRLGCQAVVKQAGVIRATNKTYF